MKNSIQYLVALKMERKFYLKNRTNTNKNFIARTVPFVNIIQFERNLSSSYENTKLPKVDDFVKKLTPVELSSTEFVQNREAIIAIIDNPYPLVLAGSIGKIFDVRKYDNIYCSINLKNKHLEQKYYENLNKLLTNENSTFIWKSYALAIYSRPYYSSKDHRQINYQLLKEYILKGETKRISLVNEKFATQLKLIKPEIKF